MLYLAVFLGLLPTLLIFGGALTRVLRSQHRFIRWEMIGASFMLAGNLGRWLVCDPNFGIDPMELTAWSFWFKRAEGFSFFMWLILFGGGYFLERRPRPGFQPWPFVGRLISLGSILLFGVLAVLARRNFSFPFLDLPWPPDRLLFMLGLIPFAIGYAWHSRKAPLIQEDVFRG